MITYKTAYGEYMDDELSPVSQKITKPKTDPCLVFKCTWNNEVGTETIESMALSSGEQLNQEILNKFLETLQHTAGSQNWEHVVAILSTLSQGMPQFQRQDQLNHIAAMLPLTHPQDKIEAMLFGQFIALHETGLNQLGSANRQGVPIQKERSYQIAAKLLNTANLTLQTLLKYRAKGEQKMQVVHVNGGQAIVAQTIQADKGPREGPEKN